MSAATLMPFDTVQGLDGLPLDAGYAYVGMPGQDPEILPKQVWFDEAMTVPAAQPLRTFNGYIHQPPGAPASIFIDGNYSVRIKDKHQREVWYVPDVFAIDPAGGRVLAWLADATNPNRGAGLVGFSRDVAYPAGTAGYALRELLTKPYVITPELFGAKGDWDGTTGTDDTTALQQWLNVGGSLHLWPGRMYRATGRLDVTKNGTKLNGNGGGIVHDTTAAVDVIHADGLSDLGFHGPLEIDGRKSLKNPAGNEAARGIALYGCDRTTVENCYIHDCVEHGLRIGQDTLDPDESLHAIVKNNRLFSNGNGVTNRGWGLWFFGQVRHLVVEGNMCFENRAGGVAIDDVSSSGVTGMESWRCTVTGNVIWSTDNNIEGSAGINIAGTRQIAVTGNVVGGYHGGIALASVQSNVVTGYGTITGNYANAPFGALRIVDGEGLEISGNTFVCEASASNQNCAVDLYSNGGTPLQHVRVGQNTIVAARRGIRLDLDSSANGLSNNVSIVGNRLFCTTANAGVSADWDGIGVGATAYNNRIRGNEIYGFNNGVTYGSSTPAKCIHNQIEGCKNFGIRVAHTNNWVIDNIIDAGVSDLRVEPTANVATTRIINNKFMGADSTDGTISSTERVNNYPASVNA